MKRIISILIAGAMVLSSVCVFADSFSDIEEILPILGELDIMKGDTDGNMRLDENVTRAEFTKVAVAASAYRNTVAENLAISPFKDVLSDNWAAPFVKVATSSNICQGYPDGTFKPENNVTYEEAITMFLKVLDYTDDDFGISWPYGQIGIAKKIGLCDNLFLSVGDALTRRDVAELSYNLLNTKSKGAKTDYINTLEYKIEDDVILIASSNEDTSVGSGKVSTSAGLFKTDENFNYDNIGRKGSIIIKNGDEIIGFIANNQEVKSCNIYQVLGDDVIVMENGNMTTIDAEKDLTVYNKSRATTLTAMLGTLSSGDVLTTYSNGNGTLDYGVIKTNEMKGPYTLADADSIDVFGLENPTVIRNGKKSTNSEINSGDIAYYSKALNTVWCYSDKITGVYENAIPNKDNPTSVVISGTTYKIEGVTAYNKLSSEGKLSYGDTITVMLGRTHEIADVKTGNSEIANTTVYGYMFGVGAKELENSDTQKYTSYYAKVALPDGKVCEYSTKQNYDTYLNSVVRLTFSDGVAEVTRSNTNSDVTGKCSWSGKTIGKNALADDVKIIDVSTLNSSENGTFVSVYPQRLDGVTLSNGDVVYVEKNEKNEIKSMILDNVTGDTYSFGIVKNAEGVAAGTFASGYYTYDIGGKTNSFTAMNKKYSVVSGQPAKFTFNALGQVSGIQALIQVQGKVSELTTTYAQVGSVKYALSDKATVYFKDGNRDYTVMMLSDLAENIKSYSVDSYYDKDIKNGGRVRVIVATKK